MVHVYSIAARRPLSRAVNATVGNSDTVLFARAEENGAGRPARALRYGTLEAARSPDLQRCCPADTTPWITARDGSSGVVATLWMAKRLVAVSQKTMSVKVPSTPIIFISS